MGAIMIIFMGNKCRYCDKSDKEVRELLFKGWGARVGGYSLGKEWAHKECNNKDFSERVIGLAELDEVMDYCEYFVRDGIKDGNRNGQYVREGKSHPVKGYWDGYEIWGKYLTSEWPAYDPDEPFASESTALFRKYKELNGKRKQGERYIHMSKEDEERDNFLDEENHKSEKKNREMLVSFNHFLIDNGWGIHNWFKLKDRYKIFKS